MREHDAGMVLPSTEPRLLADAVRRIAADPVLRTRLAANSRAAAPLYSRERQAERTLEVLQKAMNGAPRLI